MTSTDGLGELVRELRTTLETISRGLVDGLPGHLLDAEPRLAAIAARLAAHSPTDVDALRPELLEARALLRRCERLGATLVSLNGIYAARHGYGRSGLFAAGEAAGALEARG